MQWVNCDDHTVELNDRFQGSDLPHRSDAVATMSADDSTAFSENCAAIAKFLVQLFIYALFQR